MGTPKIHIIDTPELIATLVIIDGTGTPKTFSTPAFALGRLAPTGILPEAWLDGTTAPTFRTYGGPCWMPGVPQIWEGK